jgi:hypothetical protein
MLQDLWRGGQPTPYPLGPGDSFLWIVMPQFQKAAGSPINAEENRAWLLICSAMIGEHHGFLRSYRRTSVLSAVPGGELQKR